MLKIEPVSEYTIVCDVCGKESETIVDTHPMGLYANGWEVTIYPGERCDTCPDCKASKKVFRSAELKESI